MEFMGANCEGQWSSLSGLYTAEEADFMSQLLGNCSFPSQSEDGLGAIQTGLWHGHGESLSSEMATEDGNVVFPVSGHEKFYMSDSHQSFDANVSSMSMDLCIGDCFNQDMSNTCNVEDTNLAPAEENCNVTNVVSSDNPKKRTQNSTDVQKSKRNVKAKKNRKVELPCSNDEDGNGGVNMQSTSSCSEDGSDGSQETSSLSSKKAPALNSNGKTRASRGSATDPQSLYARKRRERINERLKILQNLVPNGTKVDISTMLEEAVEYVKFLQLQIKLLSSDDMWMYAPIAYNGMDIGLDFKVPATKQ